MVTQEEPWPEGTPAWVELVTPDGARLTSAPVRLPTRREQGQSGGACLGRVSLGRQQAFERQCHPVVKPLALGQQPDLEGRIDVVETGKQSVGYALGIE